MSDLIYVLSQLVDVKGNILIPGVNEGVEPLSDKEQELYNKIKFDIDHYCKEIGVHKPLKATKVCKI